MSFTVLACQACGHRVYPARIWCPVCGHDQTAPVQAEAAELLAWTRVEGRGGSAERHFATLRALPHGPILVARLVQTPLAQARWRLQTGPDGLPWAEPVPD